MPFSRKDLFCLLEASLAFLALSFDFLGSGWLFFNHRALTLERLLAGSSQVVITIELGHGFQSLPLKLLSVFSLQLLLPLLGKCDLLGLLDWNTRLDLPLLVPLPLLLDKPVILFLLFTLFFGFL